jgi:predicted amidohydrolase
MTSPDHLSREPFTVAAVQFNPEMFEFDRNLEAACMAIEEAAGNGARIIVLPEAALSGYIYRDLDQFRPYMDSVPGRATEAISAITGKFGCYVAIGIAEWDGRTDMAYNTGALVGPQGFVGKYRKNGLNPSDILWFKPGNTGYPVFPTEFGTITMLICYDDTYWEPARVAAVKGADIVAYIVSSDRVLTELGPEARANHSTIAAVQQFSTWNGVAMIAADRNNAESNPTTGVTVVYGGASSIWQADGRRTAHSPATDANMSAANKGTILYDTIDPALFDNPQRASLGERRPELYADLSFFRSPTDTAESSVTHEVTAHALQYRIVPEDFDGNITRANSLVEELRDRGVEGALVVLPACSFSGMPCRAEEADRRSESELGRTTQALCDFAGRLRSHVVGSHVERDGEDLYHCVVLIAPDGRLIGRYRQTHLDAPMRTWATAGDQLPVFETTIGRIGLLSCGDVRFPEAAGVLEVRRADIIAIPTHWDGSYGGWLQEAEGLFAHGYPANTMNFWYATAKCTQAFTVVANTVEEGCQGSSGIFTLNPVDADGPTVGSVDSSEIVSKTFTTKGDPTAWMDQRRLVGGRRADLVVPLTLRSDSEAFAQWRDSPGFDISAWSAYQG